MNINNPKKQRRVSPFFILVSILFLSFSWFVYNSILVIRELNKPKVNESYGNIDVVEVSRSQNERKQTKSTPVLTKTVIGYAVSITNCVGSRSGEQKLVDGAAVLAHSIKLVSDKSKYGYKMYAIVHPEAKVCAEPLENEGYELLVRETPIDVKDIRGTFLRENVERNGCCGEKEYNKLWSYTLTQHPVVVHLDIDTLLLQPLDELYDVIIDNSEEAKHKVKVMYDADIPDRVDAFFTRDYNMVNPGKHPVGVQGGFLVVRPEEGVLEKYKEIILEGKFFQGSGWGGKGFGGFFGGMTIQGLVPYFYDHLKLGAAVELNRCFYNSMVDNPRASSGDDNRCRDGHAECEDCRDKKVEEIKTVHYTICGKPWNCQTREYLCEDLLREWFRVRYDLEVSRIGEEATSKKLSNTWNQESRYGACKHAGESGYISLHN